MNNGIYQGMVNHRRFSPRHHSFSYKLYMLALDVNDMEQADIKRWWFGFKWYKPLRFNEKDYVKGEPGALSERIKSKVQALGGESSMQRIVMLTQVRCFGLYFSPVNFYFCYDQTGTCSQMLAEVSNTPWNQRHYYLINLTEQSTVSKKCFHVSPFMDLNMNYHWTIKPPMAGQQRLFIQIENRRGEQQGEKLFDASLLLHKKPFTDGQLAKALLATPVMTLKIVAGIYWQALKLFVKRVPFVSYQKAE